jgi:hypothetical protein
VPSLDATPIYGEYFGFTKWVFHHFEKDTGTGFVPREENMFHLPGGEKEDDGKATNVSKGVPGNFHSYSYVFVSGELQPRLCHSLFIKYIPGGKTLNGLILPSRVSGWPANVVYF